jgi:hypothetical protein
MKRILFAMISMATSMNCLADITPIHFKKGDTSTIWRGEVFNGVKTFALRMARRQVVTVHGNGMYLYTIVAPNAEVVGCGGADHCPAGGPSDNLPMDGVYLVSVLYKADGANKESITFVVE